MQHHTGVYDMFEKMMENYSTRNGIHVGKIVKYINNEFCTKLDTLDVPRVDIGDDTCTLYINELAFNSEADAFMKSSENHKMVEGVRRIPELNPDENKIKITLIISKDWEVEDTTSESHDNLKYAVSYLKEIKLGLLAVEPNIKKLMKYINTFEKNYDVAKLLGGGGLNLTQDVTTTTTVPATTAETAEVCNTTLSDTNTQDLKSTVDYLPSNQIDSLKIGIESIKKITVKKNDVNSSGILTPLTTVDINNDVTTLTYDNGDNGGNNKSAYDHEDVYENSYRFITEDKHLIFNKSLNDSNPGVELNFIENIPETSEFETDDLLNPIDFFKDAEDSDSYLDSSTKHNVITHPLKENSDFDAEKIKLRIKSNCTLPLVQLSLTSPISESSEIELIKKEKKETMGKKRDTSAVGSVDEELSVKEKKRMKKNKRKESGKVGMKRKRNPHELRDSGNGDGPVIKKKKIMSTGSTSSASVKKDIGTKRNEKLNFTVKHNEFNFFIMLSLLSYFDMNDAKRIKKCRKLHKRCINLIKFIGECEKDVNFKGSWFINYEDFIVDKTKAVCNDIKKDKMVNVKNGDDVTSGEMDVILAITHGKLIKKIEHAGKNIKTISKMISQDFRIAFMESLNERFENRSVTFTSTNGEVSTYLFEGVKI